MRRLAFLLPVLSLTACDMPQPFRHTERNPLLVIGSKAGAMVRPIANAPEWMPEAIADALRENDLAAAVGVGNSSSFVVSAEVTRNGEWAMLTWTVVDPRQKQIFAHTQPLQAADLDQPEVLQRLIGAAAPMIAQALVSPNEPEIRGPAIDLRVVQGAPADGNEALTKALREILRERGARLVKEGADLTLHGAVLISPGKGATEHVELVWTATRPGNALPIGTIRQANDLPVGTTQLSWQVVAPDIARGAADGLMDLFRRVGGKR
jgi:hypothetical protein